MLLALVISSPVLIIMVVQADIGISIKKVIIERAKKRV